MSLYYIFYMTDKLINPFTKNISFRPSVPSSRPSTTHILQSQVTPVMPNNPYPEKYSLNTYNYSNSYTQSYGQNPSYNSLSTQSYQKYNDYSPQKYSDSNLNNLIEKNPFKRTTLLNTQTKTQEPVSSYRHMSSQNWRDIPDSSYIPQKI